ncbi:MAG: class I adenylate-forming enzyme family protein [Acidimicrobiales bacterium]
MSSTAQLREAAREELRRGWRSSGWYADLTVADAIDVGASGHPNDEIVFAAADGGGGATSLAELRDGANALAGALHGAGVEPGATVCLQAPADRASTEVLEALWMLGAVVVPLVVTAGPGEIGHVIRETGASQLIVTPAWRGQTPAADAVAHRAEWGLRAVFALGDDGPPGSVPTGSLRRAPVPRPPRPDPSSVCCVLYTSGSTALPKGVQHSHETLLAGLTALPADAGSRTLATFPAGHVASLLGLLRPLAMGGTTVVMDRWSARHAAALIEEHRLTASAGTPFFLSTLLDEADASGRDISSLTRFLVGAATVPPALVSRAEARGIVSWRTYGSTEHPAISAGGPTDPADKRRSTDGRVGPGNEVRLIDEAGRDVAPGEEGEIIARGPKQFLGYRNPGLDDDAFADTSWFRTGDLGRFDPDGYLVVTDRLKDIIIRGGENISAREVEDVLAAHAAVREVAVCAVPDDRWGEIVCAFVVPCDGHKPTVEQLAAHVIGAGLAAHKAPAQVVLIDELPRTAAGKVRKQQLRTGVAVERTPAT